MYYHSYNTSYNDCYKSIEERIHQLEQENQKLKELIDLENQLLKERIEQIKPIQIENINYKIQELVVQELKGTLNIGMTGITDPTEVQKWLNEDSQEDGIQLHDIDHPENDDGNPI